MSTPISKQSESPSTTATVSIWSPSNSERTIDSPASTLSFTSPPLSPTSRGYRSGHHDCEDLRGLGVFFEDGAASSKAPADAENRQVALQNPPAPPFSPQPSVLNPILEVCDAQPHAESSMRASEWREGSEPYVYQILPCLQCAMKGMPCNKAVPSCSRCVRNGEAVCLVQRVKTAEEWKSIFNEGKRAETEHVFRQKSIYTGGLEEVLKVEESLLEQLNARLAHRNWVLPIACEGHRLSGFCAPYGLQKYDLAQAIEQMRLGDGSTKPLKSMGSLCDLWAEVSTC
ncbi:hypothetical protein NA57DRAFT_82122 [Rhizodiscina lignyota]|uniref:Zn(2)-C6 fungal-type domain-containing protein n=1 Tax=Rhizodiscina lignyota TaxID=1504668 RepID=A0A9P4I310_9PEZI|nr:hypothetical protein NA57DRAFT_82122 [Rhizodiscina lignyota]